MIQRARKPLPKEELLPGQTDVYLGSICIARLVYDPDTNMVGIWVTLEDGEHHYLHRGIVDECLSTLRKLLPENTPALTIVVPESGEGG